MSITRKVQLKGKKHKIALGFAENQLQNLQELENAIKDVSERVEMMRKVLEDFVSQRQELE